MTARITCHSLVLIAAFCIAVLGAPSPLQAQAQSEGCDAGARIPWAKAGEGFFAEAIVFGPSCAHAVVLFVARRPGGMPATDLFTGDFPVLPGSAVEDTDITPTAEVPALAGARDPAAMRAVLGPWLTERLRDKGPRTDDKLDARRAAGETRGDCGARLAWPWLMAGPGYTIEAFADGTDCLNAILALVVRSPDGKPLLGLAVPAWYFAPYYLSEAITTKDGMKEALRRWAAPCNGPPGSCDRTTEDLPEWPAGIAEGQDIIGSERWRIYTKQLDRDSWNALRAAKRPLLEIVIGRESHAKLVLMPDGRVIQAGELWVHW